MKHVMKSTCAVLVMVLGFAGTAQAGQQASMVRSAQERLNDLGYYSGPIDGIIGYQTKQALSAFQRSHGLTESGALTPETYSLIGSRFNGLHYGYYDTYGINTRYSANYRGLPYYGYGNRVVNYDRMSYSQPMNWAAANDWVNQQAQPLSIRYGSLVINQSINGGSHQYVVTLNGTPVLNANNQPTMLRVSKTYQLAGEDAVIISAYDGTGGCGYKNYLLTVKSDGTYTPAQEIGDCTGNYQARVDGNMLYISFADRNGRYEGKDIWRYSNNRLGRVYNTMARL